MPELFINQACVVLRGPVATPGRRTLPEEVAVVLSYDRVSFAVMMATPGDLEDFAVGFSVSEGIITAAADILALEIVVLEGGIECRMSLATDRGAAIAARRRYLAGPAGCGLCGIDRLQEALRPLPVAQAGPRLTHRRIAEVLTRMAALQTLNQATRGVHAAAFAGPEGGILLREDIGRHNALDKLIGALARSGADPAGGAVFLTSRVSIELIQKAAIAGISIMVAISVPSALAVRAAADCGITLAAIARDDGFEVFSHPERIDFGVA